MGVRGRLPVQLIAAARDVPGGGELGLGAREARGHAPTSGHVEDGLLEGRGVTASMVVQEFLRRRIAPLQRHSRPMWAFAGQEDPMRLQVGCLPPDVLGGMLRILTGEEHGELPEPGYPNAQLNKQGGLHRGNAALRPAGDSS